MTKWLLGVLIVALGLLLVLLVLVAAPMPKVVDDKDVFGFAEIQPGDTALPELERYQARDGAALAYRAYPAESDKALVLIHGSSYHSGGYHELALAVAEAGAASVYALNLRGHYQSGQRRGDIDYIGQLEDDIADLLEHIAAETRTRELIIAGHSSGGGLAIRFAGGEYGALANGYLLLAPIIPGAASVRNSDAGGWAVLNTRRLTGLVILNMLGVSGFNGLPIIAFNKPEQFWDGSETLSYSFRLNQSMHPRYNYQQDIAALPVRTLVITGRQDQAVDGDALISIFEEYNAQAEVRLLDDTDHFAIFSKPEAVAHITELLEAL